MTLKEMQACAAQTLSLFIDSMPESPFGEDDVHIEFVSRKNIVERFKALCAKYAPKRPITYEHCRQLESTVFANAIIGREKSAVVIRINYKTDEDNLRRIVFHELMHIYCSKTEMNTEHFIDVFGSGHTLDMNPEDKAYDGCINAGYFVWSEFIAEYFAVTKTAPFMHTCAGVADYASVLLSEAVVGNEGAKAAFAMAAAYILTCSDAGEIFGGRVCTEDLTMDGASYRDNAESLLLNCLLYLYGHIRTVKPWKITEEFIHELGHKYLVFVVANSLSG